VEGDSWVSVTGILHSMKTKGVWGGSVKLMYGITTIIMAAKIVLAVIVTMTMHIL